jgi:hypothetical protein
MNGFQLNLVFKRPYEIILENVTFHFKFGITDALSSPVILLSGKFKRIWKVRNWREGHTKYVFMLMAISWMRTWTQICNKVNMLL